MVDLSGGEFEMGSEGELAYPADGESPVRRFTLSAFSIDAEAVTNARFEEFVAETQHQTDAERYGWSFVFGGLLPDDFEPTQGVAHAPWWRRVEGADWRHPEGPQSGLDGRGDHPVVQVSWNDAVAFCEWSGTRLATEAEWEYAARGGLEGKVFPWGDDLEPSGEHRMNVWQGEFPAQNTLGDGHYGTAPVGEFEPNGFGLRNMTGNVWEWVADRFDPAFRLRDSEHDPKGPPAGTHRVQKGGSYLCHASYCRRYRVAARQANTPDGSAGNLGFRCARSGP
jgi:formylglycine-generating enzyme required for sulfatase activity